MMEACTVEGIPTTSSKTATTLDNYNSQAPLEIMASACLPTDSTDCGSPVEVLKTCTFLDGVGTALLLAKKYGHSSVIKLLKRALKSHNKAECP